MRCEIRGWLGRVALVTLAGFLFPSLPGCSKLHLGSSRHTKDYYSSVYVKDRPVFTNSSTPVIAEPVTKAEVVEVPTPAPAAPVEKAEAPKAYKFEPAQVAKEIEPPVVAKPSTPSATPPAENAEESYVYRLKSGDPVVINLRIYPQDNKVEGVIDENGNISLPFIGVVKASGYTSSQLEHIIQQRYLDEKIYKYITVNITLPAKRFFVRGEVRQPGQYTLDSQTTISQALTAAGGYTDFAEKTRIKIMRGDKSFYVSGKDIERHPEKDRMVEAGDLIIVERSIF